MESWAEGVWLASDHPVSLCGWNGLEPWSPASNPINNYNTICDFNPSGGHRLERATLLSRHVSGKRDAAFSIGASPAFWFYCLSTTSSQQNTDITDTMLFNYFCLYGRHVMYISLIIFPSLVFFLLNQTCKIKKKSICLILYYYLIEWVIGFAAYHINLVAITLFLVHKASEWFCYMNVVCFYCCLTS